MLCFVRSTTENAYQVCLCFHVRLGNKYDWWSELCLLGGQSVSLLRCDFVGFWSFLKFLKKSLWHVALKREYVKAGVRQTRTLPNSASYQFYWYSRHPPWPEPEFCLQNMNCPQPFPLICIPKLCTRMKTRSERLSKLYNN